MATTEEALKFFGLGDNLEELERIVDEYDLDADFDEEGSLVSVDLSESKEALFEEHRKNVGYRPDDPKAMERERKKVERREREEKLHREQRRVSFKRKIAANQAKKRRLNRREPRGPG